MTLSTSAISRNHAQRISGIYLLITLFCIVFSVIYELFSHEVYSWYMLGAFLYPLLGGFIPYFLIAVKRLRFPSSFSRNLLHCGIATLTCGSILQGILEIYGTTNRLIIVYWIAGFTLVCAGIICYGIQIAHMKR